MSQFQVDIHELCLRGTVRVYCEGLSMLAWNGLAPDALETDICNPNSDDCFVWIKPNVFFTFRDRDNWCQEFFSTALSSFPERHVQGFLPTKHTKYFFLELPKVILSPDHSVCPGSWTAVTFHKTTLVPFLSQAREKSSAHIHVQKGPLATVKPEFHTLIRRKCFHNNLFYCELS